MIGYSLSYSSIEDVYACADDSQNSVKEKEELLALAQDLEQQGVGYYNGEEYVLRDTRWGQEVVSTTDLASEGETEDDEI